MNRAWRAVPAAVVLAIGLAAGVAAPRAALATQVVAPGSAASGVVRQELPVPEGDAANPGEARSRADDITSRAEYQPPPKSITERISEELRKALGRVLNGLSGGGLGSAFGWVFMTVLLAIVGYLIFRVTRTVQRAPQHEPDVTIEVQRSPTEWRSEAEKYEARGEWKQALRCRYRALVADLVGRDVVPDIPGRTVGEHRGDVCESVPAATDDFAGAAELFEEAWYGDAPTGRAENQRFRELSDQVTSAAGRS
ncbi:MAG: DUF4129 domain-containing protein [Actinobacteria bacterium]|nr:DUF4129 domain-containing protein [Actinomycetota bacterium]